MKLLEVCRECKEKQQKNGLCGSRSNKEITIRRDN